MTPCLEIKSKNQHSGLWWIRVFYVTSIIHFKVNFKGQEACGGNGELDKFVEFFDMVSRKKRLNKVVVDDSGKLKSRSSFNSLNFCLKLGHFKIS